LAKARLIYRNITKSDRFNDLFEKGDTGTTAQLIYLLSYSFSDDWGHLPYDARYLKRECLPEALIPVSQIREAIKLLVEVKLWVLYKIENKQFVYIYNFDDKQRDGIRHRRRGEFPDESGKIPVRETVSGKPVSIDSCMERAQILRNKSRNYVISRNIS